ncbi:MAG: carbonic anhydrase [Alphaproteobacteria bacterium]|nr:carbonic anhydrase [Alphaproteobacteria bacterium]
MEKSFEKMMSGYQAFRRKYALGNKSIMRSLSQDGQNPKIMVVACCDSRVDPALILQCDPGDLFVARNVANLVPPYEKDGARHGTSAALEFGICMLKVSHLILLGHSQCGGVAARMQQTTMDKNDFISSWMSAVKTDPLPHMTMDDYAKESLRQSHENALTFPWIKDRVDAGTLIIHEWFFDIKSGQVFTHQKDQSVYVALSEAPLK